METFKAVDLALKAARKRQSPKTRFVHLFYGEESSDTIPLFENVCFALALLQQKQTDAVLEAKELLERLLHFQTNEGNFPVYLHEYPKCHDRWMGLKIAPLFLQIVRHFSLGLGDLKEELLQSVDRILRFAEPLERAPLWEHRFCKLRGETAPFTPKAQEEWYQWLISMQLDQAPLPVELPYHSGIEMFLEGPEVQEKWEPRPWPIEWICAESHGFPKRLLQDHPAAISAAALFPVVCAPKSDPFVVLNDANGIRLLWKENRLHSLSIPKGVWIDDSRIAFSLIGSVVPEKGDLTEVACFCDLSPETEITINGKKGTLFLLGQEVGIHTPNMNISLRFDLIEGEGDFCGAISRANRPAQIACKGDLLYEAFDWKIALRTLRRPSDCQLVVAVAVEREGSLGLPRASLSTARPMACMPLST